MLQDAPLGGGVGGVGEHALFVQLRELVQVRYPRRLLIRGRGRGRGRGRPKARCWPGGCGSTGAGRSQGLLACRVQPKLTPEPLDLGHVPGLGEPARAERRGGAGHRADLPQVGAADLKASAAHGTDQVVIGPVGNDGDEVQAYGLLGPDAVKENLVVAVRAHARRDLALIILLIRAPAEDHHTAIQAWPPGPRFIHGR